MKFEEETSSGFQMAPMVDVVFLLLIFFMCATTFYTIEREMNVDLPGTNYADALENLPGEIVINITRTGKIIINRQTIDMEQLAGMLHRAVELFPMQAVIVRADKDIKYEKVIQVLDCCKGAKVRNISVATFEEEGR